MKYKARLEKLQHLSKSRSTKREQTRRKRKNKQKFLEMNKVKNLRLKRPLNETQGNVRQPVLNFHKSKRKILSFQKHKIDYIDNKTHSQYAKYKRQHNCIFKVLTKNNFDSKIWQTRKQMRWQNLFRDIIWQNKFK